MKTANKKLFSVTGFILIFVLICLSVAYFFRNPELNKSPGDKLNVVSSVSPLTNIIYNVGGNRINLTGLIPEGTDSHTFEPSPSDAIILSKADLIILNGLHLETPTEKLAESVKKNSAEIFLLGNNTVSQKDWVFDFSFPKEKGDPNPHLWMNPLYAKNYALLTEKLLIEKDPENKDYFAANAEKFTEKIDLLDRSIEKAVDTIPPDNRKLLTYHDSWAYFANRYNMKVIGAIQPSDFNEPSPKEIAGLIEQLKSEHVPAIFGSEVFPSKTLDQISREAGVKWITTLRDDDLPGNKNSSNHTYIGMMLEDMNHMIIPLGGNTGALKDIDPSNVIN